MNERLAEQAFEMLFENPPAELAALKGSPLLADLKVLPGRAPVRASGAECVRRHQRKVHGKHENRSQTRRDPR